jgi:hypothetical protein
MRDGHWTMQINPESGKVRSQHRVRERLLGRPFGEQI